MNTMNTPTEHHTHHLEQPKDDTRTLETNTRHEDVTWARAVADMAYVGLDV